jgi:HlyD family secretion protein
MTSSSHIHPLRPPNDGMDRAIDGRSARRRRLTLAAGGAVLLAAIVAVAVWLVPSAGALTLKRGDVEMAEVRREPFQDYLPLRAEVAPLLSVYVTAVSGGQVERVLAQDGARVQAGAPLARLANPQLQLDVTAREAEIAARLGDVNTQELALQRARADRQQQIDDTSYSLLKARREVERRETLRAAGFVSEAAIKTFTDEVTYHEAKLASLKQGQTDERTIGAAQQAQIRQMSERLNSNLKVVQASLGALTVQAPTAGRLTNFTLQPGQSLKAGDAVGQVDSEGAYKLVAEIDEFYLNRVAPGQTAAAELGGRQFPMRILRVLPQVTAGRFRAELGFIGEPPSGLRRGQSLDLRLTLGDTRPALVLPNGAWLEASGGAYAFVAQPGGGRAERRAIAVGRRNPLQVEVTHGLRPGERVIVSSYAGLQPYKHLLLR